MSSQKKPSKHTPKCTCSLCGKIRYDTFVFKNGRVCEQCLEFLKDGIHSDGMK